MKSVKHYTLAELAEAIEAEVRGDQNCIITGMSTLQDATGASGKGLLAFLANPAYEKYLAATEASAVILS
ncbi:MAG: hypothetical protein MI749_10125, partial [Desulfovibrionales bacterium]|nr:hypothetical protein [Desulfovibrionales bacterium]